MATRDTKKKVAQKASDSTSSSDLGGDEVQANKDAEDALGYHGTATDPTPNKAYTVEGVTSGHPTPETDPEAAAKAREASGLGLPSKKEK